MRHVYTTLLAAVTVTVVACDDLPTQTETDLEPAFASVSATGPAGAATYEVEVTNLTSGQPFTPPLAVTHRPAIQLFEVGDPASEGIQQIAENGNLGPAMDALAGTPHASEVVVADEGPIPPVVPGETRTFTITTDQGAKLFSFASMLICTNDGFTGIDAVRLPRDVGESIELYSDAYDAGTEINTEDFDDLVPPCGPLTGVDSGGAGTGMSDPALAENGVIHHHGGVAGSADLIPAVHDWTDPVAHVAITRID
jgi:hypothetical protein